MLLATWFLVALAEPTAIVEEIQALDTEVTAGYGAGRYQDVLEQAQRALDLRIDDAGHSIDRAISLLEAGGHARRDLLASAVQNRADLDRIRDRFGEGRRQDWAAFAASM